MPHVKRFVIRLGAAPVVGPGAVSGAAVCQVHVLDAEGDVESPYGGAAGELVATDAGCVLSAGRRGAKILTPLVASYARITVYRRAVVDDGLLDLAGAPQGRFHLEVRVGGTHDEIESSGGTLLWRGLLLTEQYRDTTMGLPDTLELEAICGLGFLQEVPYTDLSGAEEHAYQGRDSLVVILQRCLARVGYELPLETACRWYPAEGAGGDPVAHLEVDGSVFYDDGGRAMKCFDVLEQIAMRLQAQLYQEHGVWRLVQRELLYTSPSATYTRYRYLPDGTPEGTLQGGAPFDLSAALLSRTVARLSGDRTFRPALASAAVRYEHGLIPSLIRAGSFEPPRAPTRSGHVTVGDDPAAWWGFSGVGSPLNVGIRVGQGRLYTRPTRASRGGLGDALAAANHVLHIPGFFHGTTRDPAAVKAAVMSNGFYAQQDGDVVEEGQRLALMGRVELTLGTGKGDGGYNVYWELSIEGTQYYARRDGSWGQTSSTLTRMQYMVEPGLLYEDRGMGLEQPYEFQFFFEAAPATGQVRLRLWGSSERTGGAADLDAAQWDDIQLLVVSEEGEQLEATRTEVVAAGGPKTEPAEEIVVRMGQGPSPRVAGHLTWDGERAGDFRSDRLTARGLDELAAETMLRQQMRPLSSRYETYQGLTASLSAALLIDNLPFAPVYVERELYSGRSSVELVRWAWDEGAAAAASTAETAGGFSATPGAAQAQVGLLSALPRYLSQHNPIATTAVDYLEGTALQTLTVHRLPGAPLEAGDPIVVIDQGTGRPYALRVTAQEVEAEDPATTEVIEVEDLEAPGQALVLDGDILSESGLYFGSRALLLLAKAAATRVQLAELNPLLRVREDVPSGSVTELPVEPAGLPDDVAVLREGDLVRIANVATGELRLAYVAADEVLNDTVLVVRDPDNHTLPLSLSAPLPAGSTIYWASRDMARRLLRSPLEDKGDLIVADAGGRGARLPLDEAPTGYVLTVDAAADLGVAWAEPAGGYLRAVYLGTAHIEETETTVTVDPASLYSYGPESVQVTPLTLLGTSHRVTNVTERRFDIEVGTAAPPGGQHFSWLVVIKVVPPAQGASTLYYATSDKVWKIDTAFAGTPEEIAQHGYTYLRDISVDEGVGILAYSASGGNSGGRIKALGGSTTTVYSADVRGVAVDPVQSLVLWSRATLGLYRTGLDGSSSTIVQSSADDTAVDIVAGVAYFAIYAPFVVRKLARMNTDGTGFQVLCDTTTAFSTSGVQPNKLKVDPWAGYAFAWHIDSAAQALKLYRYDLATGTSIMLKQVTPQGGLSTQYTLALEVDLVTQTLYYSDSLGVRTCDYDGDSDAYLTVAVSPRAMALVKEMPTGGLPPPPPTPWAVYSVDDNSNRLNRVYVDGTGRARDLGGTTLGSGPRAVVAAAGKIYVALRDSNKIVRMNLDGSALEDFKTISNVASLAVDEAGGTLYYSNYTNAQVYRIGLDGTGESLLVDMGSTLFQIAIDTQGGHIYGVTNANQLRRASLADGSGLTTLLAPGANAIGIALDVPGGHVYVGRYSDNRIHRYDLATGANEVLVATLSGQPVNLQIHSGQLYVAEYGTGVVRMNLDGSGYEVLQPITQTRAVCLYDPN